MKFANCWIQVYISLHTFVIDYELEINQKLLNDRVSWKQEQ